MKLTLIAASAVLLANTAFAHNHYYVSAIAGGAFLPDLKTHYSLLTPGITQSGSAEQEYDPGYNLGLRAGMRYNKLRYEAEYLYSQAKTEEHDSKYINNALMANVYYDFATLSQNLTPYVGAGLGWAKLQHKSTDGDKASRNVLGMQGKLGVNYAAARNIDVMVEYGYFYTTKGKFTFAETDRTLIVQDNFKNHMVNFGIVYKF